MANILGNGSDDDEDLKSVRTTNGDGLDEADHDLIGHIGNRLEQLETSEFVEPDANEFETTIDE